MEEIARGDSAISKTFSQCWKWSHLIAAACTDDQKDRFLNPFLEDDTYLLGKGGTEESAGSDTPHALGRSPDGLEASGGARWGRVGAERPQALHRQRQRGQALFYRRQIPTPTPPSRREPRSFWCRRIRRASAWARCTTRSAGVFTRTPELIFEDARVPHANVVGEVNRGIQARKGDTSEFGDLELSSNALGRVPGGGRHGDAPGENALAGR